MQSTKECKVQMTLVIFFFGSKPVATTYTVDLSVDNFQTIRSITLEPLSSEISDCDILPPSSTIVTTALEPILQPKVGSELVDATKKELASDSQTQHKKDAAMLPKVPRPRRRHPFLHVNRKRSRLRKSLSARLRYRAIKSATSQQSGPPSTTSTKSSQEQQDEASPSTMQSGDEGPLVALLHLFCRKSLPFFVWKREQTNPKYRIE